jgi:hypothetical protein
MGYRDDREALHQRVGQLEQQLADARREGVEHGREEAEARAAALEQKLAEMKDELEKMGAALQALRGAAPARRPPWPLIIAIGGLSVLLTSVGVGAALRRSHAPPVEPRPPPTHVPVETEPASVEPQAPPPTPPLAKPQPSPRSTTARWSAKVSRADGLALASGAACTIETTITAKGTNSTVSELAILCGSQKLYRSSDSLNGMSQHKDDAREKLGPSDDKSSFTLAYRDIGTRSGERTQVDLDTNARQGVVYRETIPRFRVELSIPTTSTVGTPLSGPSERLRRAGKIADVSGAAPVKQGASCVLRAMSTGNDEDCVAEVACGATVLWPSSAPVKCEYEGVRPVSVASQEGPATLSLEGSTLTMKTKTFGATVDLEPP